MVNAAYVSGASVGMCDTLVSLRHLSSYYKMLPKISSLIAAATLPLKVLLSARYQVLASWQQRCAAILFTVTVIR